MKSKFTSAVLAFTGLVVLTAYLSGCGSSGGSNNHELLNVSYDPTRELYEELNKQFIAYYGKETGQDIKVKQSHGGSAAQARAVLDGLEADIGTLALPSDTNVLAKKGLIDPDWENRLPNESLPSYSTIAFVVRKRNPTNIKDWPDLIEGEVSSL